MKLSRLISTLGATACALALAVGSSASASLPTPVGPPPNPAAHSARADGTAIANVFTPPNLEASFVPIAPCRIVDTTGGHGGAINNNAIRTFYVRGTFGFAPQGGKSGGCGIPTTASSVVATVNALNSTLAQPNSGYLLGYPVGGAVPTANFMAFKAGGNSSNPTFTMPAGGVEPSLSIKVLGGATQLAIDISGYYVPPMEGIVYTGDNTTPGSGFVYSGSPRMLSVTWLQTGIADVTMDRDVSYCTPIAGGYYDLSYTANAKAFNGNKVRVFSMYTDLSTHVTTRINYYVYLTVVC